MSHRSHNRQQQQPLTLSPARPAAQCGRRRRSPDFRETAVATVSGAGLAVVMPRHFIACLLRPGMAVRMSDQTSDTGIVTHCLPTVCIVRGEHGEEIAQTYGEVEVIGCQPDPAWIVPTVLDERPATARRRQPGRRRRIAVETPRDAKPSASSLPHTPRFSLAPEK
jgi:hypothetical protein